MKAALQILCLLAVSYCNVTYASSLNFSNTYNCTQVRGAVLQDSNKDADIYLSDFTLVIDNKEIRHNDPNQAGMTYSRKWFIDKLDILTYSKEVIGALALPQKEYSTSRDFDEVLLLQIYSRERVQVTILNNTQSVAFVTQAQCQSLTTD